MENQTNELENVVKETLDASANASETIDTASEPSTVGQKIKRGLTDIGIMILAFYGIVYLLIFYLFAIIIPPLRSPIKKGLGKLGDLIGDKYDDLIAVLTYEGDAHWMKVLSILVIEIINFYCYMYLVGAYLGVGVIMSIYALLIWPLCKPGASTVSYLYNASGHLFNRVTRCIAFNEGSHIIKKIVSIIIQLILHYYNMSLLFVVALMLCIFHVFIIWHPRLKEINPRAIRRLFSRLFKHLKAMGLLCIGCQPDDIQIEEDEDDEENILHYRKDGELDMRYASSKEAIANLLS